MPSIQEAMGRDMSGYEPVEPVARPVVAPPATNQAYYNPFLRSPVPPIWSASPDSLRQFTKNSTVPQFRIFTASNTLGSGTPTINEFASGSTTSSGGGGTTPSSPTGTATQSAFVSGAIAPGGSVRGVIQAAKSFQLLSLIATAACRIQLYGTSLAQSIDSSRAIDVSPPAGTSQNIICDVVLDTAPFTWSFQSRTGASADNPQTKVIYVTVTNLSSASTSITTTLAFVPLEN